MGDTGVAVLSWCAICALPVGVEPPAAGENRCPVCELAEPAARDPGDPEHDMVRAPERTRSIEDLV
jgi:hypothetical protein